MWACYSGDLGTKGRLGAGGPLLFLTFGVRGWVGWDRVRRGGEEGKRREGVSLFTACFCFFFVVV
jgi:hypothetical protein